MAIDYTNEAEAVQEHYADLLIMQYHSKYKARETIKLGAEMYMGENLIFEIQDILDIDKAEGAQLDLIGKILDCPRNIPGFEVDTPFFTFEHTGDDYGFSLSYQPSQGYFKSINYDYTSVYSLPDNDYRTLLKFKAIANRARASWKGIDEIFYQTFGNAITITNNKNLSITYNILQSAVTDGLLAAIKLNYLEPPLGIGYDIKYYNWNRDAFTVTGSPTITDDGIASGFSASNKISTTVSILQSKDIIMAFKFKYITPTDTPQVVWSRNQYYNLNIQPNGNIIFRTPTIAGSWYDNIANYKPDIKEGEYIYLKYVCDKTGAQYIYDSPDGSNWTQRGYRRAEDNPNRAMNNLPIYFGGLGPNAQQPYVDGFIDLKYFSIVVEDKIVFSGEQIY